MRTVFDDARFGLRLLRKNPGFAAVAILTLALGVGANAAIFSVVHAVVLRPLPFRDPDTLFVFMTSRADATPSVTSNSLPDFEDWRQQAASFADMGLLSGWTFNLTGHELPERIFGARVSGNLFSVLGATPLLGRTIGQDDDRPGLDEVAVLGYGLWQRLFAGDPQVVGRPLMLEGRPHMVIGVMRPDFHFPSQDTELWSAIKDNMSGMPRDGRFMVAAGRLKPGVTQSAAQAELDAISASLAAAYPSTNRGWRTRLATARDALVADVKPAMFLLLGAVGLVLLIACANLSNLLLARVAARTRESAVRLALGATRGRIVSQMLVENLVVALIGGAVGVLLAYAATRALVSFGPADIPRLAETRVDGIVLLFALGVSGFAGAVPALVPAFRAARAEL
jgi:predicted permease